MNEGSAMKATRHHGPVHSIREVLSAYLNTHWQKDWPISWQNMPMLDNSAVTAGQGWVNFTIEVEAIRPTGLGAHRQIITGRIVITVAAPRDTGMGGADEVTDHVLAIFGQKQIGDVRMGAIRLDRPRREGHAVLVGISVAFTMMMSRDVQDQTKKEVSE